MSAITSEIGIVAPGADACRRTAPHRTVSRTIGANRHENPMKRTLTNRGTYNTLNLYHTSPLLRLHDTQIL